MIASDVFRMEACEVCESPAVCGFGVTLEGLRMGDTGRWFCSEHSPNHRVGFTCEEWTAARAAGNLYPDVRIVSEAAE